MGDDLGVGFSDKLMIGLAQSLFQLQIVFDDAVVNDDDAPGAIAMRMRVLFSRPAVSGPARVADAVGSIERTQANDFFEVAQFSFGAPNLEIVAFINDGDAGRVVTAILELAQAVNDQRHNLLVSNVTNNSTHMFSPIK